MMENKRVALITGGIGDIGTAIAKRLDKLYDKIVALDVASPEACHDWLKELEHKDFHHIEYR
ncbi:MAG: acetoacetyl-CoA reductase, partial [Legionellales bacterium]